MKKKWLRMALCVLLLTLLCPLPARADIGPKPSVRVQFTGLGEEICYGTLLSATESNGPDSVWDGRETVDWRREMPGWEAFVAYEDPDGYYYLQESWEIQDTKELAWTYYPPTPFKVLLYFPEQDVFVSSGILERYAFDSYFTVDMAGLDIAAVWETSPLQPAQENLLQPVRAYDYTWELISLAVRIVLTILLELGIALLFKYRHRRQFLLIAGVNIVTQVALNIALNVINFNAGQYAFTAAYVLLELLVFVLESLIYSFFLPGLAPKGEDQRGCGRPVLYALTANVFSFAAGMGIAMLIPGIF